MLEEAPRSWESNLLPDQRQAVCKTGCHVCILAGPSTGKTLTLTRRIQYLIQERNVKLNELLALTFTRAATYELKNRTSEELGSGIAVPPRISITEPVHELDFLGVLA